MVLDVLHSFEAAIVPYYDLLRVFHIISIISWMAGLLYLPRLFVYHAERGTTSEVRETLSIMEWRLMNYIMHPAMAASWLTGLALLLALPGWGPHLWMIVKAVWAVCLTGLHVYFAYQVRAFRKGGRTHSGRFYRIINEVPTFLMILIVVMAILHPWDGVFADLRGE